MKKKAKLQLNKTMYSLPLRHEVSSVIHFLNAQQGEIRTAMDLGFTHAGVSQTLRHTGGYWVTVETSPEQHSLISKVLEPSTVFTLGINGQLPFEDKQFDVIALAHGSLPTSEAAAAEVVRECHRVIKPGGMLIMTVEFHKRFAISNIFQRSVSDSGATYNEAGIFKLMKAGFDVLGYRFTCRFWVQQVRLWIDKRNVNGIRLPSSNWLNLLYAVAYIMDLPLFFTRGHQMTVHARRKGWRGVQHSVLSEKMPVSDALLSDPRSESRRMALTSFGHS